MNSIHWIHWVWHDIKNMQVSQSTSSKNVWYNIKTHQLLTRDMAENVWMLISSSWNIAGATLSSIENIKHIDFSPDQQHLLNLCECSLIPQLKHWVGHSIKPPWNNLWTCVNVINILSVDSAARPAWTRF